MLLIAVSLIIMKNGKKRTWFVKVECVHPRNVTQLF